MSFCAFCKILAGELEGPLLDEGPRCAVILDRNQAARGHLLVIARAHVAWWHELDADTASEMGAMARTWAGVLVRALAPPGYNLVVNNGKAAGQEIPHAHLHLVPRVAPGGPKLLVLDEPDRQALIATLRAAR